MDLHHVNITEHALRTVCQLREATSDTSLPYVAITDTSLFSDNTKTLKITGTHKPVGNKAQS
jgi:hypothetical protein